MQDIYPEGFGFRLSICGCFFITKPNGKQCLIEKDGTIFKDEKGCTEFYFIERNSDGSTEIEIYGKQYLIEKDGTTFKDDKGRTEFDWITRHTDGSTEIEIKGIEYLIEKDEKCIKDIKENKQICK